VCDYCLKPLLVLETDCEIKLANYMSHIWMSFFAKKIGLQNLKAEGKITIADYVIHIEKAWNEVEERTREFISTLDPEKDAILLDLIDINRLGKIHPIK